MLLCVWVQEEVGIENGCMDVNVTIKVKYGILMCILTCCFEAATAASILVYLSECVHVWLKKVKTL